MSEQRITHKELPGGAVLLEKQLAEPELPADLQLENIAPFEQPEIICQFCAKEGKRVLATALLVPSSSGLALIPAAQVPPDGVEFMSLCTPHAKRAKKRVNKRLRQIRRYSTNVYTHQER